MTLQLKTFFTILFLSTIPLMAGNATGYNSGTSDFVLDNDIIKVVIDKNSGNVKSFKKNGIETTNQVGNRSGMYFDWTSSAGFDKMSGTYMRIDYATTSRIDVAFVRDYDPAVHMTPVNIEIHYVLMKDDEGLYTYSIATHPTTLKHKAGQASLDLGSWRMVWWIANNGVDYLADYIAVDEVRNWQMHKLTDVSEPTGIAEIIKFNTGVLAGDFDGKYEYSKEVWDLDAYGHTSKTNKIGMWVVQGGFEFYNGGPTSQDLNAASGIIHVCMNGVHYNSPGFEVKEGEKWNKVWGPYLLYVSEESGVQNNWQKAKDRAAYEKTQWPYSWVSQKKDEDGIVLYPKAASRGSVKGNFKISDSAFSDRNGVGARIGVTEISNPLNNWQFEAKNYQYWTVVNADGSFEIPNVRPGTYSLFAYADGTVGEYRLDNVVVSAGKASSLPNIDWKIDRTGYEVAWEIGKANRTADEFKFGHKEYSQGFIYEHFAEYFTNPIEYHTSENNWNTKLSYAHSKYLKNGVMEGWNWNLNFNVDWLPKTGVARLTIAYAGSESAQQWIYINGSNKTSFAYYPQNGGGNGLMRQTNHAKYSYKVLEIPVANLKIGSNTITLAMPSNQGFFSHIMYDYLSLELPSNQAPIINTGDSLSISENDINVGIISATDPEAKALTYSIGPGSDSDFFEINASSGMLSFKNAPDYENPLDDGANNIYWVFVNVSDSVKTSTIKIAIHVENIDDNIVNNQINHSLMGNSLSQFIIYDLMGNQHLKINELEANPRFWKSNSWASLKPGLYLIKDQSKSTPPQLFRKFK